MGEKKSDDQVTDEEIARRRDELAKRMLDTPPQPLKPKTEDGTKANQPKKRARSPRDTGRS